MIGNFAAPDKEVSASERRTLAKLPEFSMQKLFSGDFFSDFDKYSLDQFIFRDDFRGFKAFVKYNILRQKDNNGIYMVNGIINKLEYPLNEKSVLNAANKLNDIYNRYLRDINTKYAVIPDKNYFLASENGYLSIDYSRMTGLMDENISEIGYIDLFKSLSIDDYYRTDIHWDQDRLIGVADKILEEMGNAARASDAKFTRRELYPFYGSYYGQAAVKANPDTLVYLTNSTLDSAMVFDHYSGTYGKIYEPERFTGIDPYDVFLSGPQPLLTIENPDSPTNRGLILIRDSFGSSIAPLLLCGYSKITLVDLRMISAEILGSYIDFTEYQDALFLYSTSILNNSYMLK